MGLMRRSPRRWVHLGLAAAAAAVVLAAYGVGRLKRYVDSDPGLCAQCHRASPEFALWNNGSHRTVACQRCHHSTPEEGLAMLRAFLAGRSPNGDHPHGRVEVGACASCHLSHDPQWPQIEGSRGHLIHVVERKIACVTCHAAGVHGFEPVVDSCRSCHGEHTVRESGMEKLHCFACHNFLSTDPGLLPTRRDCLRCHRAEGVLPARFSDTAPMQFDCGYCHQPHARTTAGEMVDCSTCHREVQRAGLHSLHGHTSCTRCHVPHLWRAATGLCARCHGSSADHARGRRCAACHSFAGAGQPIPPRPP